MIGTTEDIGKVERQDCELVGRIAIGRDQQTGLIVTFQRPGPIRLDERVFRRLVAGSVGRRYDWVPSRTSIELTVTDEIPKTYQGLVNQQDRR